MALAALLVGMAIISLIGVQRIGLKEPVTGSAVLIIFLILLSLIDIETRRLPNWLTLPLIGLGLLQNWSLGNELLLFVLGGAMGYITIYALWLYSRMSRGSPGIGLGDAKLLAASGTWLGLYALPTVLLIASSAGLIVVLLNSKFGSAAVTRKTAIPFGPFLSLGIWAVWCNALV